MAVRLSSHELSDLCLGKPALSVTSTIADAIEVLKTCDENLESEIRSNRPNPTAGMSVSADVAFGSALVVYTTNRLGRWSVEWPNEE
ncbi:hypothetical protein CCACVL1_30928 [Corchorus capsularis]|uniref:Uncharacterized protein n=1 Tax=Corchorus capsularis TaxID=210143 RepID=A0A1R3FUM3_COCAP|nr:hypothetical protein CCACVL1_30928 [Corchorus capsularis]